MRKTLIAFSIALLALPAIASAESDDDEGVIRSVDTQHGTITLDDGKVFTAPSEFDFNGLEPGVKVIIYYTTDKGKRVIDDLQTE